MKTLLNLVKGKTNKKTMESFTKTLNNDSMVKVKGGYEDIIVDFWPPLIPESELQLIYPENNNKQQQ